jgi:hypothetical protein
MSSFTNEQVEALAGRKLNSTVLCHVTEWRLEGEVEPTLQPYGPFDQILPYPGICVRMEAEDVANFKNSTKRFQATVPNSEMQGAE